MYVRRCNSNGRLGHWRLTRLTTMSMAVGDVMSVGSRFAFLFLSVKFTKRGRCDKMRQTGAVSHTTRERGVVKIKKKLALGALHYQKAGRKSHCATLVDELGDGLSSGWWKRISNFLFSVELRGSRWSSWCHSHGVLSISLACCLSESQQCLVCGRAGNLNKIISQSARLFR